MTPNDKDTAFPASPDTPGQKTSREAYNAFAFQFEDTPIWDDYLLLRERFAAMGCKYDWRKCLWLLWDGMSKGARKAANLPETQKDFAHNILACSEKTIQNWQKDKNFLKDVGRAPITQLMIKRAAFIDALSGGATKAKDNAAFFQYLKVALEMTGDYVPTSKQRLVDEEDNPLPVVQIYLPDNGRNP